MSNRRKIRPQPGLDDRPAHVSGLPDGTITVEWPHGRGQTVTLTPAALEALVEAHNAAVLGTPEPAPATGRWWRRWQR